jgi:hypothetical protein
MTTKITIYQGTPFSQCDKSTDGIWKSCDNLKETAKTYDGEFSYDISGPYKATFSSPSFKDCRGEPNAIKSSCNITLRFKNDNIIAIDQMALAYPALPPPPEEKKTNDPASLPEPTGTNNPGQPTREGDIAPIQSGCQTTVDCGVQFIQTNYPSILLALGAAALFGVLLKHSIPANNATLGSSKARRNFSRSTSPRARHFTHNQDTATLASQSQDLSNISNQLRSISNRLEKLDSRIFALESESTATSVRGFTRTPDFPQTQVATTTPVPIESISPPPPLSEQLILQAVSKTDYSLIKSYPHLFLNETQDSRQGKLESKCFEVIGDQTESSSHANAEFIAITFNSKTYLIPNIIPNAADPRRTLKRHVDANSIYRAGSGSNILNIQTLAEVEQTFATAYELTKAGQIS